MLLWTNYEFSCKTGSWCSAENTCWTQLITLCISISQQFMILNVLVWQQEGSETHTPKCHYIHAYKVFGKKFWIVYKILQISLDTFLILLNQYTMYISIPYISETVLLWSSSVQTIEQGSLYEVTIIIKIHKEQRQNYRNTFHLIKTVYR